MIESIRRTRNAGRHLASIAYRTVTRAAQRVARRFERSMGPPEELPDALHIEERNLLNLRLEAAVWQAREHGYSNDVFLTIDLDGYTAISASYGEDAARELLVSVGARVQGCLRPTDAMARVGCDEFAILLYCSSARPIADVISHHIQKELAIPFVIEGQRIAVSASVGIARVLPHHECAADVTRDANAAVHQAKMLGGNQCALFDDGMHEKMKAKLQFEAELRHALTRREFLLHFQPIVSAKTGRIASLEALIRWNHPTRGCLPPSQFLEALVAMGLMTQVGRWIMEEACTHAGTLRQRSGFDASISVNVSPRQLLEPNFVEDMLAIIATKGARPEWIAFEITEDIALGDGDAAMRVLRELRAHGMKVRIDDFGTGYSSLSYLQRLPVDGLKVDRAFLEQFESDEHRREIVGAIIRLAHVLGLDVVAEGVERHDQLVRLRELECDYVQGYHIATPLSAQALSEWMRLREPTP